MEQVAEPVSSTLRDHDEDILSDEFRMSCMKVVPCSKRFVHDWTECPFAHPQEKARRRDPKIHTYTGIACPSMKKEGSCAFGDHCPYAHNVFEYWLHPTRYRTQLCNDGSNCRRKICFFAHSLDELRVPACKPFVSPEGLAAAAAAAASDNEIRRKAGFVGTPMANLNAMVGPTSGPSRVSVDSIRQSCEWGPVAMPGAGGGSSDNLMSPNSPQEISPTDAMESPSSLAPGQHQMQQQVGSDASAQRQQQEDVRFSAHEQQVIEAVTNMLAEDTLSATQAATILQQMLPANSLQLLQSRLGFVASAEEATTGGTGSRKAGSDPLVHQMHHQDQMIMAASPRTSFDMTGGSVAAARQSMESTRSSFDTARYSFDGRRASSDASPTPRGSMEGYMQQQQQPPQQQQQAYAPPAPAYPQDPQQQQQRTSSDAKPPLPPQRYWTGQQLTTVPEGLPVINTPHSHLWGTSTAPVRRSTGSVNMGATSSGNLSVASRLSSDFNRMSFDEATAAAGAANAAEQSNKVNPYASAFFSGGHGSGDMGAYDEYAQRPSW
ncbi:hypothetical protein Ndes2526B_g07803 [Nannochloris sp. 'desiccata']|nr:putative Zinc finger CCCH domain-containing protein 50 [Chlorella desiccata (nom. nud.)]